MLASGNIKNNKAFSYKYDPSNLRYSKTVNGVETLYYWDDGVLLGERTGDNFIQYIYDADGIAGMRYNGAHYYFEKNLFGDVLRVYSVYGSVVATFKYDSYGNITSSSGSMADKVKIRYRGYYYDDETGFYYLQSRYYDPSLCRFISADQYELVGMLSQTLGQINLYAYCNNNPIMYTDESGEGIITALIIGLIIGGIAVGGVYGGLNSSNTGWGLVGDIALGGLKGGLTAAVLAISLYGGGSLIGYGAGLIGSAFALAGGGMIGSGAAVGVAAVATGVGVMVSGGVIANQLGILYAEWKQGSWPGDDPTIAPGDGFIWRGPGEVGSAKGEWYNPNTGDQLHPDLNHPWPKGPHWGWRNKLLKIFIDLFKGGNIHG